MPRPKTVSDDALLDAVERVLHAQGPHDFTLADVAREVGLAPATLLQRYGTKRALVLAFARRASSQTSELLERTGPGLSGLRRSLVALARPLGERQRMVHGLALLLEDLRDPELGAAAREQADAMTKAVERHLRAAVAAGELRAVDPRGLALTVQTVWNGALILWAIRARGSLRAAVLRALDAVLEPYLS